MRMRVPITGTVKGIEPHISGDLDDPISMININLGDVSWQFIRLDLDAEEMEIEVTPNPEASYDTGELDDAGDPVLARRPTTTEERTQAIENARNYSLERMSKKALYALSKSPRLKNPFKHL